MAALTSQVRYGNPPAETEIIQITGQVLLPALNRNRGEHHPVTPRDHQ